MIDETAKEYADSYKAWQNEYRPVKYVEYSAENLVLMESQDPRYVWTDHSTCDNEQLTSGFHVFNNSCCWNTHGWHITEVASTPDNYVTTSSYLPCPVCNGEGEDGCPGPDAIDGAEISDGCEEGHVQWYFD